MNETMHILIVDDDAVTLRATCRILKSAGYQITEASTGADGLRLAREQSPDLILLDLVMDDMSDVEVCQRIKADPQLANVFVVLLSSIKMDSDSQAQGLEAGADGYIARPIANRELVARVQALLRIKAAEDALRVSEERFRAVIENAGAGYFRLGRDGCFENVNAAWLQMHGYDALSQVIGKHFALTQVDADLDAAQKNVERLFSGGPIPAGEFSRRCRDGSIGYHSFSANPTWRAGRVVGLEGFLIDITERKRAEEALQNAASKWQTTFDAVNDAVWLLDKEQRNVLANQATQRVFNLTPENIIGKHCWQVVHGTPEPISECPIIRMQKSLHRESTELAIGERWVEVTVDPILDEAGRYTEAVHIVSDITERKRAEENVRLSEARYRSLVETQADIISRSDLSGNLTFVNDSYCRTFGVPRDQLLGTSFTPTVFPDDLPIILETLEAIKHPPYRKYVEIRNITSQGVRWFAWDSSAVLDEQEHILEVQGVGRDITERKRAEDVMRALSARHQATLAAVPDIIMEVDNNKIYTWANQAGLKFFGAEVIGKEAAFYFEGEQETYNVVQPLFNGNEDVIYVESWQRRHDGEKRLLGWWCRMLKDAQGNVMGALSTAHDITDRKRVEAALKEYSERLEQMVDERTRALRDAQEQLLRQERLTVLGQVAGGISHELRGPLGVIKNATYLLNLALPSPDAETTEMLQILKQQVANSERIITSLMDFARLEPPYRRAIDVREVIEAALAQSALPANITVHQQYDANLPPLRADPDQLEIVFGNLIRNAVQAMPEGGQLTIDARQTSQTSEVSQDFGSLEISFRDTGVGIAPEILDKIFQPLFSTKARGMGLGLALCKLLVEGHNGTIQVTSQVGKGTTFTICLPMA